MRGRAAKRLLGITLLGLMVGAGAAAGASPLQSEYAGRGGWGAASSVFRIVCPQLGRGGTGFLHKSGRIITADHVVNGCPAPYVVQHDGVAVLAQIEAEDTDLDLALLKTATQIAGDPLSISTAEGHDMGAQVAAWGYPDGYSAILPMLTVGFLAGVDTVGPRGTRQWVVNGAFNLGNSGGPLLAANTGDVIGVVDSKVAPLSPDGAWAINALGAQSRGRRYRAPNGNRMSEAQVIAIALAALAQQRQLVIGRAVIEGDLRSFLAIHGIEP